jgi:hypothetical protein
MEGRTLPEALPHTRMKPPTRRTAALNHEQCGRWPHVVHRVPLSAASSPLGELCGDDVVLVGDKRDDVVAKRFELAEVVGQRPDEHALRTAHSVGADAFSALLG